MSFERLPAWLASGRTLPLGWPKGTPTKRFGPRNPQADLYGLKIMGSPVGVGPCKNTKWVLENDKNGSWVLNGCGMLKLIHKFQCFFVLGFERDSAYSSLQRRTHD